MVGAFSIKVHNCAEQSEPGDRVRIHTGHEGSLQLLQPQCFFDPQSDVSSPLGLTLLELIFNSFKDCALSVAGR